MTSDGNGEARGDVARTEVLRRVRSALGGTTRVSAEEIPRDYHHERTSDDTVGLFHTRVADYRAHVRRVDADEVGEAIAEAMDQVGARRVVAPAGVPDQWRAVLTTRLGGAHTVDDGTAIDTATLDGTDAVVTTATVGIASTGTIVLDHGPGQGRRAVTLVPDTHVCVVDETQIVDDVPRAMRLLDPSGPLTFISGPSATSDIELNRVEGVHGPRTLHVLITSSTS